ncbi:sushi domain-containing protein 2-like isoform X2 [Oculina patagonica]
MPFSQYAYIHCLEMKSAVIMIPLLLLVCEEILTSQAIILPNFYPFGQSEGDQVLPPNDDGSSGTMPISIPFPFFDQYHNSLFVNNNGVISFLVEVSQYTPDTFPLGGNRRLVAPFWADVDTGNGGDVFYRETTDPNLLQQATDDVKAAYVDQRKFKATWLLIATWYEVAFYGASGGYTNRRNTFQAVLITNGRHSFVIFNYNKITWTTGTASGGDDAGLGGSPAQAGFNAGDGIRYFNIPGSATDQVIDIPKKSNVGKPGRWMFRIDSAKIEAGGCNTKGSLVVSPRSGIMLGGDNIFIAGPCYTSSDLIICEFPGGKVSNGSYISNIRASCTVPMLSTTGRLSIKMSVNGGKSFDFQGSFTTVNINRVRPRVFRLAPATWIEKFPVKIKWDPGYLGSEKQTVTIQLARFSTMNDGHVYFHSMFPLIAEQLNTGEGQLAVPKGQGQGAVVGDGRFVTLVLVKKTGVSLRNSPNDWIWSDLFSWLSYGWGPKRCKYWYRKQPNPKIYTDDASLLPCPQTFLQAMADRGRFTLDEYCNPKVEHHCVIYHFGATHCFRTNTPSNQGAGQQCCYNKQGNLMVGPQNGGSLDRFHIETGVPVFSHFFHDLVPYLDCCLLSDNCAKYFEKRPSDDGSNYEPPRPATGFGDPHMITLDGVEYTFNGYGEYQILNVAGPDFKLQGRMQPLINDDGSSTRATIYKAFAMTENGSDVVQVHINGRNEIEVLVNGDLMEFDEDLMIDFNGVIVLKYNNTSKFSTIFDSGISVTTEKVEDILQMMLLVPPMFKGNTSGLLGFWNGKQENEFLLPNGTFLDTNSSQTTIHYKFGQLWATTANNSLFTYDEGKNHSSFFDVGYVPIFLDRDDLVFDNATLGQQARDVCGDNKQCLFDIHSTGKVSIGEASKQAVESFVAVINETETPGCIPIENTLSNGTVLRNDTQDGGIIYRFHCNPGYQLNDSSVISCLHGKWNGSKPSCQLECIPIENALGNGTVLRNDTQDGGIIYRYHCNLGFQLNGSFVVSCLHGEWNGSKPSCHQTVCLPVGSFENGHAHANGTSVGSRYWFTCAKGFTLIGSNTIVCGKDGQWNGTLPKCSKDITSRSTPWYIFVAISAAVVVVAVTVVVGVICFLRVRRKNRQRDKEQATSQVEMKEGSKEDVISFNNPAYASYDDIK